MLVGGVPMAGRDGGQGAGALFGSASGFRFIRLLGGAVTLCVHFAGVVEGSPGGTRPGKVPGRQVADLRAGIDWGDQAGDLG